VADVKNSIGTWRDELLSNFLKILGVPNGDLCRKRDLVLSIRSQTVSSNLQGAEPFLERLFKSPADAMVSPTDFIEIVRVGSAPGNFSKVNLGIFTTQ